MFGHWEGDLLIFERELGHANVTSLVERKSRYTVMIKNPSRHSRPIMDKIIETFSPLPSLARQSFTFDRARRLPASRLWKIVPAPAAGSVNRARSGKRVP